MKRKPIFAPTVFSLCPQINSAQPVPFNKLPVEVVEAATAAVEVAAVVWLAARTVLEEAGRLGVLWIVAWHTWPR